MATNAYYAWDRNGRPITPCRPIRETVNRLKVAYPRAAKANLFSWYADDAHYQADRPQDHTPYSATPWPVSPNPYPYVFATDVMHRPDLDLDCHVLFAYWIAEARAGRMPWLKYMIWQGRIYDVRNGWEPRKATGHFDHIHKSTRTDHIETSLGAWKLVPGEEDDMPNPLRADNDFHALIERVENIHNLNEGIPADAPNKGEGSPLVVAIRSLLASAEDTRKRLEAIEAALGAGGPGQTLAISGGQIRFGDPADA